MAFVVITGGIDIPRLDQRATSVASAPQEAGGAGHRFGVFPGSRPGRSAGVQRLTVATRGCRRWWSPSRHDVLLGTRARAVGVSGVTRSRDQRVPDGFMESVDGEPVGRSDPVLIFAALSRSMRLLHCTNYGPCRVFSVGSTQRGPLLGARRASDVMSTYVSPVSAPPRRIVLTSYLGGARSDLGSGADAAHRYASSLRRLHHRGQGGRSSAAIAGVVVGARVRIVQMAGCPPYITVGTNAARRLAAVKGSPSVFTAPRRSGGGDNIKGVAPARLMRIG
jgi:hypothetical protein